MHLRLKKDKVKSLIIMLKGMMRFISDLKQYFA